jgi:hypothetical protein
MDEIYMKFVIAPDHMLETADEILHATIRCTKALRTQIRAVAKAYIDEADEMRRGANDAKSDGTRVQLQTLSPRDMIENAKAIASVALANKELEKKVRAIAESYVEIAEENQRLYDEFKKRYRDKLPPPSEGW